MKAIRINSVTSLAVILAALLVFGRDVNATPILTVDQQNLGAITGSNGAGVSPASFGQSFTPTLNSIDAIEFLIGGTNATVHVDILDGLVGFDGLGGTVLGTSGALFVNVSPHQTFHFDFPNSIALTPGNIYVARLMMTSGSGLFVRETGDAYGGGQYLNEALSPSIVVDRDLIFTEGLHQATASPSVPEPSTLALFGLGAISLAIRTRRRTAA